MCARETFLEHAGARLRVRENGSGPAVLLLHGWALDCDMWKPQLSALAGDYRVVAFDRRGFGYSSGVPSIEADVQDARAILASLDIERASLVGMSQGARVAMSLAQGSRALVSCLVLDGPPATLPMNVDAANEIPIDHYRSIVRTRGIETVRREWQHHALTQLHTNDAAMHALLRAIIGRYPGRDLLSEAFITQPPCVACDAIDIPVLVINGAYDSPERLAAGEALAGAVAGARRALVPRAGHLPNLDNPSFYNDLLREFFVRHASRSRS